MSKKEARLILQALEYEEARTNYAKYCQIVNGPKWVLGRHLQFVCKAVEMFIDRKVEQKILILSMPPQHGKLCSDDTPVLTPNGWKTHGELKIGDYVFGRNGDPVKVTNILNENGVANYEVEFVDGLINTSFPVIKKDPKTKEIIAEYYSVSKAAQSIGVAQSSLRFRLRKGGEVFYKGFIFMYKENL